MSRSPDTAVTKKERPTRHVATILNPIWAMLIGLAKDNFHILRYGAIYESSRTTNFRCRSVIAQAPVPANDTVHLRRQLVSHEP